MLAFNQLELIRFAQHVTLQYRCHRRVAIITTEPAVNAKLLKNWLIFLAALWFSCTVLAKGSLPPGQIAVTDLPIEARHTLVLIKNGGPYPYGKDGTIFRNYERILPKRERGYYREFTVKTPGVRNRGARRIVSGGDPPSSGEYYYTDDHYATFKRIRE